MNKLLCVVVGVGSGLGLSIARKFGEEGCRVVMLARRTTAIADYAKMLNELGIEAYSFSVDVTDATSIVDTFNQIQQTLGHPDILIYNAAASSAGDIFTGTTDNFVQDFKINVVGAIVAIQQVAPQMKSRQQGTILLTGGGTALDPFPSVASLAIGKAGIRNLSFSLSKAFEPDGVHVATVTICGVIGSEPKFAPDEIAQVYWTLHTQVEDEWQREAVIGQVGDFKF